MHEKQKVSKNGKPQRSLTEGMKTRQHRTRYLKNNYSILLCKCCYAHKLELFFTLSLELSFKYSFRVLSPLKREKQIKTAVVIHNVCLMQTAAISWL